MSNARLTPVQEATFNAAADRIVPADEFPSAGEAGAMVYVRRLLERDLPEQWPTLTAGLDLLDAAARSEHGSGFVELTADRQDAVLTAMHGTPEPAAQTFVRWLVERVLESYYADPANGGNAGAVSWRMVGYDPRVPGYDGGIR